MKRAILFGFTAIALAFGTVAKAVPLQSLLDGANFTSNNGLVTFSNFSFTGSPEVDIGPTEVTGTEGGFEARPNNVCISNDCLMLFEYDVTASPGLSVLNIGTS